MTIPPPPTNAAGEPIDPSRDLVAIAAHGMGLAVLLGSGLVLLVLLGVRLLLAHAAPSDRPAAAGPAFPLLIFGTLAAMTAAVVTAWWRLAPITSTYRRGALSIVCGFATLVSAILATPVHYYFGQPGLLVAAALSLLGAGALGWSGSRTDP